MSWFAAIVISLVSYAASHLVDSNLSNRRFKHPQSILFFSGLGNVLWLPLLYASGGGGPVGYELAIPFIAIGMCELGYLYPYYSSQRLADSSVVGSLFIFKRLFTPILAFLFLSELLSPLQYAGVMIILIAPILSQSRLLRSQIPRKVVMFMVFASFLLSIQEVITKAAINELSWVTVAFWCGVVNLIGNLMLLIIPNFRAKVRSDLGALPRAVKPLLLNELFGLVGNLCALYALSLQSVTVISSFFSFTGFATMILSYLLRGYIPDAWRESHDREAVVKKICFFLVMVVGAILLGSSSQ